MPARICIAIGSMVALGIGCDDPAVPPDVSGLPQGLTLFSQDPVDGLTGMYAEGELAVFFETAREVEEEPAEQHDQFSRDGTAVNVSARFIDMEGRNLLVAQAGHGVPAEWHTEGEPSDVMGAARPQLFVMVGKAAEAIDARSLDADADVDVEKATLLLIGGSMLPPTDASPPPELDGAAVFSAGFNHWQWVEIHNARCCGALGEHSATVFWNYSEVYGWEDGWQTNNHGRWATAMPYKCGKWSPYGRPHYRGGRLQFCDSFGSSYNRPCIGGGHVCNDDTLVQYNNIAYGTQYGGGGHGTCRDGSCRRWAPDCF